MKTPYKIAGLVLFVALTVPGFAQDKPVVPYVDMSTAQALVDTLLKENESLKADAIKQRQEVAALTEQITLTKKWINDLVPILEEVKARNAEVATVSEPIVDRVLKAKAITAAEKNKAAEKKIAKRIDELGAKIIELNKQIEPKLNQASVDDAKVGRNNDDIVLLQATISKTKVQEADLTAVIERVDALTTKVDSFVQQSLAAIK